MQLLTSDLKVQAVIWRTGLHGSKNQGMHRIVSNIQKWNGGSLLYTSEANFGNFIIVL
jgi:hypothetical protein